MVNERSLLFVCPNPAGYYILLIACEAMPNEFFEVEFMIYAGMQREKTILWVDSYGVEDCTIEDEEKIKSLADAVLENPNLLALAQKVVERDRPSDIEDVMPDEI